MVVVKINSSLPAFTIIDKEKETVRLGDFSEEGNLSQDAMERGVAALKRCRAIAESFRAEDIVAVATSAVREAKNGQDFLEQVKREVGLSINLISGTEEARRIYLGVLSGMEFKNRPHAVIDIGGGSTELLLGTGDIHRFLSSTKVGAVRLTARFVTTDPISDEEFTYLSAYVRGRMEPPVEDLKRHLGPGETFRLVGTSGTAECLAALVADEASAEAMLDHAGVAVAAADLLAAGAAERDGGVAAAVEEEEALLARLDPRLEVLQQRSEKRRQAPSVAVDHLAVVLDGDLQHGAS